MKAGSNQIVLVTGATGYVGGRLVPRLIEAGYTVRCLVRDPNRLAGRAWVEKVEVVVGDVLDPSTLDVALQNVRSAYYLVHSMGAGPQFCERDRRAARNFGEAAQRIGVGCIIYLGGLGDPDSDLSEHLESRQEVGQLLGEAGVPVMEFRASVIVGSGSLSFEMIRYLAERIPIMICPKWVYVRVQPIHVEDVLDYLMASLEVSPREARVVEIGGNDVLTYGEMIRGYAEVRGLRRVLLPVPVLTPRLSSYWVHWMTPIPASISQPLIEGLRNETIVRDPSGARLFPNVQPINYRDALREALQVQKTGQLESCWSDSILSSKGDREVVELEDWEGLIVEARARRVNVSAGAVFRTVCTLGGDTGWLYANWAWKLRGVMDRMLGGVGFRRGRRSMHSLRVGDALDFWRVEALEPGCMLRLRAEMKVPGWAWLQFDLKREGESACILNQRAIFAPRGLPGWLYWYALYPMHALIFSGLIKRIAERAERMAGADKGAST